MKKGFDNDLYVKKQSKHILERIEQFGNKLYLEFGGKLFDDYHASRCLPGFEIDTKIKMLAELKDKTEIIFCIGAQDIEKNKIRADIGITYDMDILRQIDNIKKMGIETNSILITRYTGQHSADVFIKKVESMGVKTYIHKPIKGYPLDIDYVVSDEGYGANEFIKTTKPLVVVTAPGPGSGKLATCLNQLYHEHKNGNMAGYAKFETFPVWNLPLEHPLNVAYEAATVDLDDINMIDSFHLEAYGETTVNYNRDIDAFPVIRKMLSRLMGENVYKSPTDMGVNMVGKCFIDDDVVREASKQEIIRRYYKTLCENKLGTVSDSAVKKSLKLMMEVDIEPTDRVIVNPAKEKYEQSKMPSIAVQLKDGTIITGRDNKLMSASASVVLNSLKYMAGISDNIVLLPQQILEPIIAMKSNYREDDHRLNLNEVLLALSISAVTNPNAQAVLPFVEDIKGIDLHSTHILSSMDEKSFRELGVNVTCEPNLPTDNLYFV